jgi:hypothetical protein
MLEFSECMRAHGVTNFPDPAKLPSSPPPIGATFLGNGPNPNTSPIYRAASAACRRYAVAEPVTPAGAAEMQAEQLRYAQCLRAHGEPGFPDPSANGGFVVPKSIDENSPVFRRAERDCVSVQPRLPGLPASNGSHG